MAVRLSPVFQPDAAAVDANGVPRTGGLLFTYLAGTATAVTTYKDSAAAVAHTNPIVLNSNGLPTAPIWLTEGTTHKFVLAPSTDSTPPTSPILTIDNITGINDAAVNPPSEWIASGLTPTPVTGDQFTVPGDQTGVLEVSRRIRATTLGGTLYGTIIRSVYTSLTTVTVEPDEGTAGAIQVISAFDYGIASVTNTSLLYVSRAQQCGRLSRTSATLIQLDPSDGNTIWVYTGGGWRLRTIPSAGVTAANTNVYINGVLGNLAADLTYFVYLWDNAGVLTMDFSATGTAVNSVSGLRVKSSDATRLLIGIVRTNGSSQFSLVLSWFRRRSMTQSASLTTPRTTTSTSATELHSELRVPFLSWAEEAVLAQFSGIATNSNVGQAHNTYITLDGTATAVSPSLGVNAAVAANYDNVSGAGQTTVTEGFHYATITVLVSANTGTWATGTLSVLTQG